jgi:hypothetical protein
MSLKNPVTPPGVDPGTARLEAQRLNHYTTPGPERTFCQIKNRDISTFRKVVETPGYKHLKRKSTGGNAANGKFVPREKALGA